MRAEQVCDIICSMRGQPSAHLSELEICSEGPQILTCTALHTESATFVNCTDIQRNILHSDELHTKCQMPVPGLVAGETKDLKLP